MRQLIRVVCFCVVFMPLSGHLVAQNFEDLISGSKADANYLMEGYSAPFMKALGAGLNQGWYNTAKPHKKFGVDLTISVAAIAIPSSDKFFTVNNSKLQSIELTTDHSGQAVTSGTGKVPTVFGPNKTSSEYDFVSPAPSAPFSIAGAGIADLPMSRLPVPVINLGFGLPKSIDIKLRFVPTIGPAEAKFSLFGVGLMHDVKQYIPGIKMLPFDLSGFVGYTRMSVKSELSDTDPTKKGEFNVSATTIQALISKKIAVLTFYGGVGYNFSKSINRRG